MTETKKELKAEITETIEEKAKEIIKEEATIRKQGTRRTKRARSKGGERMKGTREKTGSQAAEARASTEVEEAMQAWDWTMAIMTQVSTPATVARAAYHAMQWTARVWNFHAQDAVEAVMMKVESRLPLTFSPSTLGRPQVGIALRVIADKLMKHQSGGEITRAIWNATKRARIAQSGSSAYTTEVTGKFGSLYHATQEWQIHYRKREHCEMRTCTIAETIRSTN